MKLAAVLLHHSVHATCIDSAATAAAVAAAAVHSLAADDAVFTWSVMIPVYPNEFISLPVVEQHLKHNFQISRKKECIVVSGRSLDALLKVTAPLVSQNLQQRHVDTFNVALELR